MAGKACPLVVGVNSVALVVLRSLEVVAWRLFVTRIGLRIVMPLTVPAVLILKNANFE